MLYDNADDADDEDDDDEDDDDEDDDDEIAACVLILRGRSIKSRHFR